MELSREAPDESPVFTDLSHAETKEGKELKTMYGIILQVIDKGLSYDDEGKNSNAIQFYKTAERQITNAKKLAGWSKAECSEIKEDILKLEQQLAPRIAKLEKPARPETKPPEIGVPSTDANCVLPSSLEATARMHDLPTALAIPDGANFYKISSDSSVRLPSYPSLIRVCRLDVSPRAGVSPPNQEDDSLPPAFLQVGDWVYPLYPGASPVFLAKNGSYIFPDINSSDTGDSIGVDLSGFVTVSDRKKLNHLFETFADLKIEGVASKIVPSAPPLEEDVLPPARPPPPLVEPSAPSMHIELTPKKNKTEIVSTGMVKAAEKISAGMLKGAEKTAVFVQNQASKYRATHPECRTPKPVNPDVQSALTAARCGTHYLAKGTGIVLTSVVSTCGVMASYMAPIIKSEANKRLPKSWTVSSPHSGQSKVDKATQLAGAGLASFGTLWVALEESAFALGRVIAKEGSATVRHTHGIEAGKATENALYSAGNLGVGINNYKNLGIKALAKRTAKETGKALLCELETKNGVGNHAPSTSATGYHNHQAPYNNQH